VDTYWDLKRAENTENRFKKSLQNDDFKIPKVGVTISGPGSSVGIATGYSLGGPGIESRWGRDFPHLSRPALGPTQPHVLYNGYRVFPGGRKRPGRDAEPSPLLVPRSKTE
jgi:hypothetical protein